MLKGKISLFLQKQDYYALAFILALVLLYFALPLHRVSTSIPLIFTFFSFGILLFFSSKIVKPDLLLSLKNKYVIVLFCLFVCYVLNSILFMYDRAINFHTLQLKFFFFATCVVLFFGLNRFKNLYVALIYSFLLGLLFLSFFILVNAFWHFDGSNYTIFFYKDLTEVVKSSPTILSYFFNIALLFSVWLFGKNKLKPIYLVLLFIWFAIIIGLLASRVGYLILVFNFFYLVFNLSKHNFLYGLLILFFLSIPIVLIYVSPQNFLKQRVKGLIWQVKNYDKLPEEEKIVRLEVWKESIYLLKENYIVGVGPGHLKEALKNRFVLSDFDKGIKDSYDAHNQFLNTAIEVGIIGLLLIVLLFIFMLYDSWQNSLMLMFTIYSFLYFMIESILESQSGMMGFLMLLCLIVNNKSINNE